MNQCQLKYPSSIQSGSYIAFAIVPSWVNSYCPCCPVWPRVTQSADLGTIYVCGGYSDVQRLRAVERFSPSTGNWEVPFSDVAGPIASTIRAPPP